MLVGHPQSQESNFSPLFDHALHVDTYMGLGKARMFRFSFCNCVSSVIFALFIDNLWRTLHIIKEDQGGSSYCASSYPKNRGFMY